MNTNIFQDLYSYIKNRWYARDLKITHNTIFSIVPKELQSKTLKESNYPQVKASHYWINGELVTARVFRSVVEQGNIEGEIYAAPYLSEISDSIFEMTHHLVIVDHSGDSYYAVSGAFFARDEDMVQAMISLWTKVNL